MKNMKLISSFIVVFIVLIAYHQTFGQLSATINYNSVGVAPGSVIQVPVVMNGSGVGNWQLIIDYDRDVLTYVTTDKTPLQLLGYTLAIESPNYANSNLPGYPKPYYKFTAAISSPGVNFANQIAFTISFVFNGGNTNFSFVNIAATNTNTQGWFTFIATYPGGSGGTINTSAVFTGGSASGSYGTLHSVAAGGDWNTPATWLENAGGGTKVPSTAYNVFITANDVVVNSASGSGKCHNLTVNSGGRLTLNFGKTLNITGAYTIESNGSFVDQNLTSTLSATVKRNITGNYSGSGSATPSTIWHFVSAPTSNATIGTFLGCLMNKWTENSAGGIWDTLYLPLTLPLQVGKGYSIAAPGTFGDAVFSGPLNTGNITISGLTNSNPVPGSGNGYYGYNLIGNPFPCAVKWDAGVTRTNVDAAAYLWNGSTYLSKLPTDNYEIQAEQGFFVHATSAGSVTIPNGNRVHSSGSYLKSSVENQLTLTVTGNGFQDETSVRFYDEATTGFDGEYDAYKMFGVYNCPQIYSILPDFNLSINSLNGLMSQSVVPVGFKTGLAGAFTINAAGMETFETGTDLYLTDLFTGAIQNLAVNPVYAFNASPANPEHRFDLHFAPVGLKDNNSLSGIRIYSFENRVYVNIPTDLKGDIHVYDMLGKQIIKRQIESNSVNKIELNAVGGYYLVQVVADKISTSAKVFIR